MLGRNIFPSPREVLQRFPKDHLRAASRIPFHGIEEVNITVVRSFERGECDVVVGESAVREPSAECDGRDFEPD